MAYLDGILMLASVFCFALFLAHVSHLPAPVLPLAVLSGGIAWLFVWGLAGALFWGGIAWLVLALVALAFVLWRQRTCVRAAFARLNHVGFWLFFVGSVGFWVLFAVRQPMFTQWDEFTFWGTAMKLTVTQDILHAAAQGTLSARAYPPSMMLLAYFFQFLSDGFAEWKAFAAVDSFLLASFCAASAIFATGAGMRLPRRAAKTPSCAVQEDGAGTAHSDSKDTVQIQQSTHTATPIWQRAVLLVVCASVLLFFFAARDTRASTVYFTVMSDWVLGATFGGALCLYFAAGHRKTGLIAVGVVLFALTLMKEIGLAYAVIVVGCIFLDKIFACDGAFWRGFGKRLLNAFACACNLALPFLVGYFAWTKYVLATTGVDKAVVGSETSGTAVSYGFVLVDGVLQLLGMGDASYAEKFADVQGKMLAAFTEIDVCLLGGGALAIALILAVLAVAIFTAQKGAPRRRAVMFTVANTCAFVVFVVFHLFLYVYNFAANEAAALKDYDRYITPYYLGWLLAALCLLCAVTGEGKKAAFARLAQVCVCVAICAAVCLWGVPSSGFWNESNMNYAERLDVQSRAAIANEVLDWEDEVFIISQGDDATRWYYYTYELNATVAFGYAGGAYTEEGARYWLTTASSLIEPDTKSAYTYTAQCAQEDLVAFLRDMGYTHVLVDESDEYVYAEFGALFDEALPETWESGVVVLYEIVDDGTTMQFVRVAGGQYETVE